MPLLDCAIDGKPPSLRNALTIASALRERGIKIPIITFSGWPDLIDWPRAKELGILRV